MLFSGYKPLRLSAKNVPFLNTVLAPAQVCGTGGEETR